MFIWANRHGAGASYTEFRPSPFLRLAGQLTALCLRLLAIAFVVTFLYVVITGGELGVEDLLHPGVVHQNQLTDGPQRHATPTSFGDEQVADVGYQSKFGTDLVVGPPHPRQLLREVIFDAVSLSSAMRRFTSVARYWRASAIGSTPHGRPHEVGRQP